MSDCTGRENFVSYLGHDLRSHLNAILGFSRIVIRRSELSAQQRENMDKIIFSADQLLQLINTMVDLAKAESQLLIIDNNPVDLPGLLGNLVDGLKSKADAKGLILKTQWLTIANTVSTDEYRLHQALSYLLDNAIRYTEQGAVTLEVRQQQDRFIFSVTDTGPGLTPQRLEQLLTSNAPIEGAAGTGLGIVLTRLLVSLMSGSFTATSQPGSGSCFQFELSLPVISERTVPVSDTSRSGEGIRNAYLVPSTDTVTYLSELALQGDIRGILTQCESLNKDYTAFAAELSALAKGFQINKISELLASFK